MLILLAQQVTYSSQTSAAGIVPFIVGMMIGLAIGLAIIAVVAWLISDALSKVPQQYRQIEPGQVWLLLIPFFNWYWNFVVFKKIPESFQAYFEATGRPQPGDYGKQLGLIYSILSICSIIPCVGAIAGLAALVLLILLIVKFVGYKNMIISGGGQGFPVSQ